MKNNKPFSSWFDLVHNKLYHGDIVELPVLSGSMMPLLIPGKNIKIKCLYWRDVQIGDIIIFKHERNLTAHRLLMRIVLFNTSFFYQKGDANRFGSWITKDQIVGIVLFTQDNYEKFIDLTTLYKKRQAREKAVKQLFSIFYNVLLIIPRRIKWRLEKGQGNSA